MEPKFPARLHVLLSRDDNRGLIIRRGPAKAVASIGWDRRRDTFQLGQWLRGRIYERRCDLSYDGQYWIYFAMNGHWGSQSKGAWTAIARAPYLKALVMLPKGDCWHGGGLFTQHHRYWLNNGYGHELLRDSTRVTRDRDYRPVGAYGGECLGVYYPRLLRDGWALRRDVDREGEATFEKPLPKGWTLRKRARASIDHPAGSGCYWDEHELLDPNGERPFDTASWEWADRDVSRLVWASEGKLFAARFGRKKMHESKELLDANALSFERIEAPY